MVGEADLRQHALVQLLSPERPPSAIGHAAGGVLGTRGATPLPGRGRGGGAAARRLWEAAGAAAPPAMELSFGVAGQRPGNLPAAAAVASCVRVSAPYGAGTARHLRSPHPRRGRLGTRAAESRLCALRPPSVSRSQAPSDRGPPCPSASFGAFSSAPCCW